MARETVLKFEEIPAPQRDFLWDSVDEHLVGYVTKLVRHSFEYQELTHLMKNFAGLDRDLFYDRFNVHRFTSSAIELHHFPIPLHDISETVAWKHLKEKGRWTPFEAAEEAVQAHYRFTVGLLPLSPTVHELVHAGALKLHLDHVPARFQWRKFLSEYQEWMTEEAKAKILELEEYSRDHRPDEFPDILKRQLTTLDISGVERVTGQGVHALVTDNKQRALRAL